jgi:3-hydroxybutyryl-CoA dehydrogenase
MERIAVIGAGTMGNGIAHVLSLHGYATLLLDIDHTILDAAIKKIANNLDRQVKKEHISEIQKTQSLQRLNSSIHLEDVAKSDLVIEAVTEDRKSKFELFTRLDDICRGEVILASNTSSLSITAIAAATRRPDKVIGMHFMNPVPVMPLVEIVRGTKTSNETVDQVLTLSQKLDKTPITVRDFPGFISNRILMPMINEAIHALHEGVAGVKEIDTIMSLGMSHPMGPLKLADFIGLDVCLSIINVLYDGFRNPKYAPCPLLINMVNAGFLGVKSKIGFYDWNTDPKEPSVAKQFVE